MKRTTFNVSFYIRRTRLSKKGEAPILLRITCTGTRAVSALTLRVKPEQWNATEGKSTGRDRESKELNLHLDTIRARIMQIHREMEIDEVQFIAQNIIDQYQGKNAKTQVMLMEAYKEHNEKCHKLIGIDVVAATTRRYEVTFRRTAKFIKAYYGKDDIPMQDVNHKFITDYEFYIKTEFNCAHNTTMKYLKNLKKIIRIALANDDITKDPFANIKFALTKVDREVLSDREVQSIVSKEFSIERLSQVRDFFIFACFTGLAFSDLEGLKREHIIADEDGRQWIRKKRQKTDQMCNIPLLEIPEQIIEKYKDHKICATTDRVLPIISNVKMNAYLKEVMDLCGITKDVSTHIARHTFATYMLSKGVSIQNVADMLGHSNLKMTQHYAKVLDKSIMDEMLKVGEQIKYSL